MPLQKIGARQGEYTHGKVVPAEAGPNDEAKQGWWLSQSDVPRRTSSTVRRKLVPMIPVSMGLLDKHAGVRLPG